MTNFRELTTTLYIFGGEKKQIKLKVSEQLGQLLSQNDMKIELTHFEKIQTNLFSFYLIKDNIDLKTWTTHFISEKHFDQMFTTIESYLNEYTTKEICSS
jgi:hypothetical protein